MSEAQTVKQQVARATQARMTVAEQHLLELLIYDELTLTEISYRLHYSSVAHLSNQFKKITGLTPTFFKNLKHKRLEGLDIL